MNLSGRQLAVLLLAVLTGMAGCGGQGEKFSAPRDEVAMEAPPEPPGGELDPESSPPDGDGSWKGAEPPEMAAEPGGEDAPEAPVSPPSPVEDPGSFAPPNGPLSAGSPRTGPSAPGIGISSIPMTPNTSAAPTTSTPPEPAVADGYTLEKVYYGTDRKPESTGAERWATYGSMLRRFQVLLVVGLALCGLAFHVSRRKILIAIPAVLCLTGSAWFGRHAMLESQRAQRDDANQNRRYGSEIHFDGGEHVLERGYCWVSVPDKVHERGSGQLEEAGLFEVQSNPEEHFTLQRVQQMDRESFLQDLRADVQSSPAKHAFVFIHGYNVLFREAALRTAQLRYDLNFDGPAAFFSWPSNGSLVSYASDEETVNLTERSGVLHRFLTDFVSETGAESVHLIAHSMGNRLMTRAFEKLPDTTNSQGQKTISQLIMAAPDVNPAEFMLLADRIKDLTRSRTLYASEKDIALIGSEVLRMSNYTRLGQGGPSRVIVDGVQTIDASDLGRDLFDLGHSYYVHPLVMQDLKHLLNTADISQMRPWLRSVGDYWTFREQ